MCSVDKFITRLNNYSCILTLNTPEQFHFRVVTAVAVLTMRLSFVEEELRKTGLAQYTSWHAQTPK